VSFQKLALSWRRCFRSPSTLWHPFYPLASLLPFGIPSTLWHPFSTMASLFHHGIPFPPWHPLSARWYPFNPHGTPFPSPSMAPLYPSVAWPSPYDMHLPLMASARLEGMPSLLLGIPCPWRVFFMASLCPPGMACISSLMTGCLS
jgi:hypothetical protein